MSGITLSVVVLENIINHGLDSIWKMLGGGIEEKDYTVSYELFFPVLKDAVVRYGEKKIIEYLSAEETALNIWYLWSGKLLADVNDVIEAVKIILKEEPDQNDINDWYLCLAEAIKENKALETALNLQYQSTSLKQQEEILDRVRKLTGDNKKQDIDNDTKKIGICSFERNLEFLQSETEDTLDLIKYFDGRFIRKDCTWEKIYSILQKYLQSKMNHMYCYQLFLETHYTIAFMAGRILDTKSGIYTVPIQKTSKGMVTWEKDDSSAAEYEDISIERYIMNKKGQDTVIVLGVSRYIFQDVADYIQRAGINTGIIYKIGVAPGISAVKDGNHAWQIAEQITQCIDSRQICEKKGRIHLFTACPVVLMYILGRMSLSYGKIVLYEQDFEKNRDGSYYRTAELPIDNRRG